MNELELIKAKDALAKEKEKIQRFLNLLNTYKDDMPLTAKTTLEQNLIDNLNDIFEAANKLQQ